MQTANALSWKHVKDELMYFDNDYAVQQLEQGIDQLDEVINKSDEIKIFHCYWYGNMGRKQVFSIKSFLCTQDMHKCKVILWLDINDGYDQHQQNLLIKEIEPFIEIRCYDPIIEAKDTPWERYVELPDDRYDLVQRADAFRFLMLYKYGGVYFDLDIMFLKDLYHLVNTEFCYAWEIQPYANTALFSLQRRGKIATYLLQKAVQQGVASPWRIFWYSDQNLKELLVYPCAYFDPIWQGLEGTAYPFTHFYSFFRSFDETFVNRLNIKTYREFFPGCYAYHWHNQWNAQESENSFFGLFEAEFNTLLKQINSK